MIKKQQIVGIVFVVTIFALVSVAAKSDNQAGIQSKKSHAEKLWMGSGHADKEAEAFTHWDEDGAIDFFCAKCHSTPGFLDFIEDDRVNNDAPIGTTVECEVCHTDSENGILRDRTHVVFPSKVRIENLGPEALCMECHQGRASTKTVNEAITSAAVQDDDTPNPSLEFINIHYYAAAANQFGTIAKGGYEYEGKTYDARFPHVKGYNACITCHNPHSLEVDLQACNTCHLDTLDPSKADPFNGLKDPKDIRYFGSFVDYDGDGDMTEGIYYEIADLKPRLYSAIQRYALTIIGSPIVYDSHAYPYFFFDTNENGLPDESEANFGNRYTAFSARLLRAAYNYQVSQKDPANYAHGGKYIIQLLYDSIEDLNSKLNNPVSMARMHRVDEGHFDGSAEAWRHFDEDGEVVFFCAKCHSTEGLPHFLETGKLTDQEVANGMLCTTCHTSPPNLIRVDSVTFPSGAVEDIGDSSNICMECHQGRASRFTVTQTIASDPGPYEFINIHYYPNAAILFGNEVQAGFEFEGKTYTGQKLYPNHNGKFDTCVECHMGTKSGRAPFDFTGENHNVQAPNPVDCVFCHGQDVSQPNPGADPEKFEFTGIRPYTTPDYDGDGNITESVKDELSGLEKILITQIQTYAANKIGAPIIYANNYPYFFNDNNGNGVVDPGENIFPNAYMSFNSRLLKAAYNYQLSKKAPSGYAHNSRYVAQLLVDSIGFLGGDVTPYTWR